MKPMLWILTVIAIALAPGLSAEAGCYACVSSCCKKAEKGKFGAEVCRNDRICVGSSCSCNDCYTTGGSCKGTEPPKCDKPLGNCEENQTYRVIPYGVPVDLQLLLRPALREPAPRDLSAAACDAA